MNSRTPEASSALQPNLQVGLRPPGCCRAIGLLLLTMSLAPGAPSADCNVSANVVGYVNVSLPGNAAQSLIANPLNGTNNHLGTILPLPNTADGTMISRWKPAVQAYGAPILFVDGIGWVSDDPDPNWLVLDPGEGFFIENPTGSPLAVTFVGEVPEGTLATSIPVGVSYLASKVPQGRPLGQSGASGTLQFPAADGDAAFLWNAGSQSFGPYSFLDGFWAPSDPVIGVAQGFGASRSAAGTWTRHFVVSCSTGPRLAIGLVGGQVQVSWSAAGWQLQESGDPEGPWAAVAGGPVSPFVAPPLAPMKFYRLARADIPTPRLNGLTWLGNGGFRFGFTNLSGISFTVVGTTNLTLASSNWPALGAASEITSGQYQFTDTAATNAGRRFYQIRSP